MTGLCRVFKSTILSCSLLIHRCLLLSSSCGAGVADTALAVRSHFRRLRVFDKRNFQNFSGRVVGMDSIQPDAYCMTTTNCIPSLFQILRKCPRVFHFDVLHPHSIKLFDVFKNFLAAAGSGRCWLILKSLSPMTKVCRNNA